MELQDLQDGLGELDALSRSEYDSPLAEVMNDANAELALQRLSRLVGVALKEPLAVRKEAPTGTGVTKARYQWWLSQDRYDEAVAAGAWQLQLIERLKEEVGQDDPYVASLTTFAFVDHAQSERGLFSWLAQPVRKYICNDPEARAAVEQAFQRAMGTDAVKAPTPEWIVTTAGATVATYLTKDFPALAVAGPVIVSGLTLVLYSRGVGAFYRWAQYPSGTAHVTSEMA